MLSTGNIAKNKEIKSELANSSSLDSTLGNPVPPGSDPSSLATYLIISSTNLTNNSCKDLFDNY